MIPSNDRIFMKIDRMVKIFRKLIDISTVQLIAVILTLSLLNFSFYIGTFGGTYHVLIDAYSISSHTLFIIFRWLVSYYFVKFALSLIDTIFKYVLSSNRNQYDINKNLICYYTAGTLFLLFYLGSSLFTFFMFLFVAILCSWLSVEHRTLHMLDVYIKRNKFSFKKQIFMYLRLVSRMGRIRFLRKLEVSKILLILVTSSIALGICRSEHVKNFEKFRIYVDGGDAQEFSIFLTSNNGIFTWSNADERMTFFGWNEGLKIEPVDKCSVDLNSHSQKYDIMDNIYLSIVCLIR